MALAASSAAFANTPLLENTEIDGFEGWIAGSNLFVGGTWQAFVSAPDAYAFEDRVTPEGDGFVFTSWDDGESDTIESFFFQEFPAGPVGSPTSTIFETGDVIVFKGSASAVRSGADTSDMKVRAFIKTLGFVNNMAFQTKDEYTVFYDISDSLESFELAITYPDLAVDDSLQVIQLGFEITTSFDGANMDSGEIFFKDLEGYVEGEGGTTWAGFEVDAEGFANTGDWMGWVYVNEAPYIFSYNLDKYVYIDEAAVTENGAWVFIP